MIQIYCFIVERSVAAYIARAKFAIDYTGCSVTHGTNVDSLYKNLKITLFQE